MPSAPHIILNNGDRIAGIPLTIVDTSLRFNAELLRDAANQRKALRFPLTAIASIWLVPPDSTEQELSANSIANPLSNDRVQLRNDDAILGTVTEIDSQKNEVTVALKEAKRTIDLKQTARIEFSNKIARIRKPAGPYGHLVLTNGSRITIQSPIIRDDLLQATTLYKDSFAVRLSDVRALDIYQGQAIYLSDLKPAKYAYRSYLGEIFNWSADRNLSGGPLQLKTKKGLSTFDKGIAVHSESTLTYALDGKYRRFETLVGLDARYGKSGSVQIHVTVDGKEQAIAGSKDLTAEKGPLAIRANLIGAKELNLTVSWGEGGNVGDHVNWADARLILK